MHTRICIVTMYHYLHFDSWNIICGSENFINLCTDILGYRRCKKNKDQRACLDSSWSVSFKRGCLKCPYSKAEHITLCIWEKGHKCYYLNSLIMTLSWGHHKSSSPLQSATLNSLYLFFLVVSCFPSRLERFFCNLIDHVQISCQNTAESNTYVVYGQRRGKGGNSLTSLLFLVCSLYWTVHIIALFHSFPTTVLTEVTRSDLLCRSSLQRSLDNTLKQYTNLVRLAAYRKTFMLKLLKF